MGNGQKFRLPGLKSVGTSDIFILLCLCLSKTAFRLNPCAVGYRDHMDFFCLLVPLSASEYHTDMKKGNHQMAPSLNIVGILFGTH